jgi:TatD DNase family protein
MINASTFSAVDFHCHLDLFPDHLAAIAATEAASIFTLAVTTTPKAWTRNRDLAQGRRFIRAALGLHPQLVAGRAHELPEWKSYLSETCFIGEVGLDGGPRFYKSLEAQKRIFRTMLECCAAAGGKVLSVHSVRSASDVLDMIETYLPPDRGTVVLHWFTGSRSEAQRAISMGCYFSINAAMERSKLGRNLIANVPRNKLLTETDSPFTQKQNMPARSTDVHLATEAIARIRGETPTRINNDVCETLATILATTSYK